MNERLIIRSFGAPHDVVEHIASEGIARPLKEGEMLVRILASPINPADLNWIAGNYGVRPLLPETPGSEACAEVIESRSTKFSSGARVIFLGYAHGWQKYRIAHENEVLQVPSAMDALQCAMLKVNPATAWLMLKQAGGFSATHAVIQNAANSGVGQCVIQLTRALNLPCLHFLRRSEDHEFLRSLGAEAIFSDDPEGHQNAREYLSKNHLKAVLALNAVGGDSALRLLDLLEPQSLHLTYGAMSRRPLTIPNKYLIFQNIRVHGFWLSSWMKQTPINEIRHVYQELIQFLQMHDMKQRVDSYFPISDYASALERNSSNQKRGKVLFEYEPSMTVNG